MIERQKAIGALAQLLYQSEGQRFGNKDWNLIANETRQKYLVMAIMAFSHVEDCLQLKEEQIK